MLLHYKYPRYLEDGALAFSSSLPTIYSSVTSPLGAVQHLCRQLGLPLTCVRPVPVNTHFGKIVCKEQNYFCYYPILLKYFNACVHYKYINANFDQ